MGGLFSPVGAISCTDFFIQPYKNTIFHSAHTSVTDAVMQCYILLHFHTMEKLVFSFKSAPTALSNFGEPPWPPRRGVQAMGFRVSVLVWVVPAGQAGEGDGV